MRSKEFIIKSINEIVSSFPYLNIKYENESFSKSHYIEVSPKKFYDEDLKYIEVEKKITQTFIEQFPNEILTFLSENSYYKIENPIYERGFVTDNLLLSFEYNNSGFDLFNDFTAQFPSEIENISKQTPDIPPIFNTNVTSINNTNVFDVENLQLSHNEELGTTLVEENYGLAA